MRAQLLAFVILIATLIGCDQRLKTAVPDLDLSGPKTCELYTQKGRGVAEAAWARDWAAFAPMFETSADPFADEEYCRGVITGLGAVIRTKGPDQKHSTAIMVAVLLDPDFESKSQVRQASTMCHEAAHIVWQHRVGPLMAIADYVSISGRLSVEAVAYALGDKVLRRHGVSEAKIAKARLRRSAKFPEVYKLTRTVSPQCVYDYLTAVSEALEARTASQPPSYESSSARALLGPSMIAGFLLGARAIL